MLRGASHLTGFDLRERPHLYEPLTDAVRKVTSRPAVVAHPLAMPLAFVSQWLSDNRYMLVVRRWIISDSPIGSESLNNPPAGEWGQSQSGA